VLRALVFDFDGLIVDTERPSLEAWRATFEHFGCPPPALARWADSIGRPSDDPAHFDPFGHLQALYRARGGPELRAEEVREVRVEVRDRLLAAEPVRPGVLRWIAAAAEASVPVAIASSSPAEWVDTHLASRGVLAHFAHRVHAGGSLRGKPHPDTYLEACRRLGVEATGALAFEDSAHGVSAAKAAGLRCVAIPNSVTAAARFDHADLVVASLDDLDPADYLPG